MKSSYKKSTLFAIAVLSCLNFTALMSSNSNLSATFQIIPNASTAQNSNTQYTAEITIINNGSKITNGWRLDFDLSSPDQSLRKCWSGKATTSGNHISIINSPQHIRIAQAGVRKIRVEINKNATTVPTIPTITATVL